MRNALVPTAFVSLLLAAGCGDNASPGPTATATTAAAGASTDGSQSSALTPEQLGALGAQIKKQPNDADRLLSQSGLTEQSFAAAVRKVSEDPAAARRYTASFKSAS